MNANCWCGVALFRFGEINQAKVRSGVAAKVAGLEYESSLKDNL